MMVVRTERRKLASDNCSAVGTPPYRLEDPHPPYYRLENLHPPMSGSFRDIIIIVNKNDAN
jgi:hypothetical protein